MELLTISELIIFGFAAWRLSEFFITDDGPMNVFEKIRNSADVYYGEFFEEEGDYNFWGRLLTCHYCLGIYSAAFVVLLSVVSIIPALIIIVNILAVSAIPPLIAEVIEFIKSYNSVTAEDEVDG